MRDLRSIVFNWLVPIVATIVVTFATPAAAQELTLLNGFTRDRAIGGDDSFARGVDYSEPLSEHYSYSLIYMNEGHLVDHHRDGIGTQLWAHTDFLNHHLSLGVGVGPYIYFDTAAQQLPNTYADEHGVGVISSLTTTWYLTERWGVQVRANYISVPRTIDTSSYLVGVSYKFDATALPSTSTSWSSITSNTNEVTAYLGKTYVNDFESPTAVGEALEYRRNLSRNVDWTISAINEGNPGPLDRRGVMTELWATRTVFKDHLSFGIGLGPYLSYDRRDDDSERLLAVVSLTAGYRLSDHWITRLTWHRVATDYNKDTDVFLAGVGYRW